MATILKKSLENRKAQLPQLSILVGNIDITSLLDSKC